MTVVPMVECMLVVIGGDWASRGRRYGARLIRLVGERLRGDLWESGILRKVICVVVVVDGDVRPLGCFLRAAAVAAREDVTIGSRDGSDGLFRVAIYRGGGGVPRGNGVHFHGSRLI